jgi:ADP-ribose pyrophosphatase
MKVKGRKRVYDGFLKVDKLTIELEDGKEVTREVVVRKDAVAALVYNTKDKQYILVKQFRPGPETTIVEIVAGTMDVEGETPEHCIEREIEEEIGYKVDELEFITWCYFSPGGLTEKIHIFYAEVSEKISAGGGVDDENIETVLVSEEGLNEYLVHDSKTVIAIQWLSKRRLSNAIFNNKY